MKLKNVMIKNFRSIKEQDVDFKKTCQILVGMNESGKSNILRAIRLLAVDFNATEDDLRESSSEEEPVKESFVRFVFTFDSTDKDAICESIEKNLLSKDIKNEPLWSDNGKKMTLMDLCQQKFKEGLYRVDIITKKKYPQCWKHSAFRVFDGWKAVSASCPKNVQVNIGNNQLVQLSSYRAVNKKDFPDIPENYLSELTADVLMVICNQHVHARIIEQLPVCIFWEYKDENLLPGKIDLSRFTNDPSSCVPLENMFYLSGCEDITLAIQEAQTRTNGMRNLLTRVEETTSKHIQSVWKEHKGIGIYLAQNGPHIEAGVRDKYTNNVYNFERRSDGFKRFITFLLLVSAKERRDLLKDTVILIDEPDICLHPSGAKLLRDELIKISKTNLILFSTHSIFMIDRENTSRHLIVKKEKEITTAESANESNILDEEVIFNALGYSVFESLNSKNIIFEGWWDKMLFRTSLRTKDPSKLVVKKFAKFGTCHAEGNKDIPRIASMLDLANRQFVIISDDDASAIDHQKKYHGVGEWCRYSELLGHGQMTSEDFVKADHLTKEISKLSDKYDVLRNKVLPSFDGTNMRLIEIKRWLTSAGLPNEEKDIFMKNLKEMIFAKLEPKNIEDRYFEMLEKLFERLI
jgi:predicted ATP-dependent endonuclease of OLD family